jgi:cyclophilin family peptidyl-prolyl cis-trans isomerase
LDGGGHERLITAAPFPVTTLAARRYQDVSMRFARLPLMFAALMAMPALAQDAAAPATPPPAAPAPMPAEQFMNNPEYMLAIDLSTGGRVIIQLRPDKAPGHVERIRVLARQGFYNGLIFHRVIDGFMAQGGDPNGNGTGGSTMPNLTAEFNDLPHVRGVLSMARSEDRNSANSQFFIMLLPRLTLDRNYTALGRVVSGMQYIDLIERGEPPANPTRIIQMSVMADNLPMPSFTIPAPAPAAPAAPITADDLNAPIPPGQ